MGQVGMGAGLISSPLRLAEIVSLIGERSVILHAPATDQSEAGLSGRDVDCAISGLDTMWPLRLSEGWRLCQCIQYDLRGWYWVVERAGEVIALDTIEDPMGLGRDGIRTESFLEGQWTSPTPATRAAYLTIKRLRKGTRSTGEWRRIGRLARDDPNAYVEALERAGGPALAQLIVPAAVEGTPPSEAVLEQAARIRWRRRFGSIVRVGSMLTLATQRYSRRILHPTGLFVLITGPDGSGKSTLAAAFPELCKGMFKRQTHNHWRPGLLPRPGVLLGRSPSDPSRPHARRPFGPVASHVLLGYYWADFALGGILTGWSSRIRAGLLVRERDWWDLAVDPGRYRLTVSPRLVGMLGRLLMPADLAFVLQAPPETIRSRKDELGRDELHRQTTAWRSMALGAKRTVLVDASRPFDEVAEQVREETLRYLEARETSRLGAGWTSLPLIDRGRWHLPRGPRRAAIGGLSIYQPVTLKGRVAWEAGRLLAMAGGFRLLGRGHAPPRAVREVLAPHVPPRTSVAVMRANHVGRYVALLTGERGVHAVAKIATTPEGAKALETEATALDAFREQVPSPLSVPRVLVTEPGLLLLEAVRWRPRARPWHLDEDVARALGAFFRAGARQTDEGPRGPRHGDCAPWNLLRTQQGWALVDWESADEDGRPYEDLCHYFVQSTTLLSRPSVSALVQGFARAEGWIGAAVGAYAAGASIPQAEACRWLVTYLRNSWDSVVARTAHEQRGLAIRQEILRETERTGCAS